MNVKLVKLGNFYAVRKGIWIFGYKYLDLKSFGFWWEKGERHFNDCLTDDEELAMAEFSKLASDVVIK